MACYFCASVEVVVVDRNRSRLSRTEMTFVSLHATDDDDRFCEGPGMLIRKSCMTIL